MNLLIVDDEKDYVQMLALALNAEGFECEVAYDGQQGLAEFKSGKFDLVVCDVNMPEMNGFALCQKIRELDRYVPFIFLTSRDDAVDETIGLDFGADDYVRKPVENAVLIARVRALLRRSQLGVPTDSDVKLGDLSMSSETRVVTWSDCPIDLTSVEFNLLWKLAGAPGRVFERTALLAAMRGDETFVDERMVDSYINRIRRKLENAGAPKGVIETVVGVGYRARRA